MGRARRSARGLGCATAMAFAALACAPTAAGALPAGGSTDSVATPSCTVYAHPSDDIAAVVADAAEGATICLTPGTYPITQPIQPNADQTIDGGGRATLIGSEPLTGFEPVGGGLWATTVHADLGARTGECLSGTGNACRLPNAVFDGRRPLRRVMTPSALGPGSFLSRGHTVTVAGDPSGHRLEIALASVAISSNPDDADPDVTIDGLTVEMFATPAQHGAIDTSAPGWTIEDDRVELNHGAGVATEGDVTIEHVDASDNGEEGIAGTGDDTMVRDNLIADNNWAGFDPGWEAGGAKWGAASNLEVLDNVVRDNQGPGLWSDVGSTEVTYQGNTVTGNSLAGIFYEISSDATISDNSVSRNGFGMDVWLWGSGILIAESSGVEVSDNTVANNANAIGLVQQDRGDGSDGQPLVLHAVSIADNVVDLGTGSVGMVTDDGDDAIYSDPTISFEANVYSHCAGTPFLWDGTSLSSTAWRALGHDVGGVFRCSHTP